MTNDSPNLVPNGGFPHTITCRRALVALGIPVCILGGAVMRCEGDKTQSYRPLTHFVAYVNPERASSPNQARPISKNQRNGLSFTVFTVSKVTRQFTRLAGCGVSRLCIRFLGSPAKTPLLANLPTPTTLLKLHRQCRHLAVVPPQVKHHRILRSLALHQIPQFALLKSHSPCDLPLVECVEAGI